MNKKYKVIFIALLILLIVVISTMFFSPLKYIWENNIADKDNDIELYIPSGSSFDDVKQLLIDSNALKNVKIFDIVSGLLNYKKDNVPSGRYILKSPMNTISIVRKFRAGDQTPVNVTFNNVRTINELAGRIGNKLALDSIQIMEKVNDADYLSNLGFNKDDILSMFIPNTYQMFWNISVDKFFDRMKSEYDKFWNARKEKLDSSGMSATEIYTIASIVEKETLVSDEKPKIASVYLNRLKTGMKLQADPTVVFANGDFSLTRVYNKHLSIDSPYNTYMYEGLPPGPICMPDVSTIDAVLNSEDTDFIFFCAAPDNSGRHLFAKNLAEHARNANKYRQWLDKLNVK
ncbi:MAG: endolytic transglycosylase MltG [Saprospiraceae bacterium]